MFLKSNLLYAVIMGLLLFVLAACTVETTAPDPDPGPDPAPNPSSALKLMSASSVSPTSLKLIFSDAVGASASQPSNYSIAGLTVESAVITGVSVDLTTSAQTDQQYIVNVSNLASAAGASLDVNASSASFQGTAPPPVATGARYKITFDSLFLRTDGCDAGDVEIYYAMKVNGTNVAAVPSSNNLNMDAGETHTINASREVEVTPSKPLNLSISVADDDGLNADDVLVSHNPTLSYPLSEGAQDVTESGNDCSVRVAWTVIKLNDIFN